jgi:hypothetical protein
MDESRTLFVQHLVAATSDGVNRIHTRSMS